MAETVRMPRCGTRVEIEAPRASELASAPAYDLCRVNPFGRWGDVHPCSRQEAERRTHSHPSRCSGRHRGDVAQAWPGARWVKQ